jgi:hypothetical protein
LEPPEQEQEEPTQRFSLLLLNEEKSVQIEAAIVEEPEELEDEAVEQVFEEEQSLISFSEEVIEIAKIEEATVAIAVDALKIPRAIRLIRCFNMFLYSLLRVEYAL